MTLKKFIILFSTKIRGVSIWVVIWKIGYLIIRHPARIPILLWIRGISFTFLYLIILRNCCFLHSQLSGFIFFILRAATNALRSHFIYKYVIYILKNLILSATGVDEYPRVLHVTLDLSLTFETVYPNTRGLDCLAVLHFDSRCYQSIRWIFSHWMGFYSLSRKTRSLLMPICPTFWPSIC